MAEFLDTALHSFDTAIFSFFGSLQCDFLNPIADFITMFGTGIAFAIYAVIAILLIVYKKTRRYGVALAFALAIGGLITNIILKPWIARPRPYVGLMGTDFWDLYRDFYTFVGSPLESDMSFPSGHTTVAFEVAVSTTFVAAEKKNRIRFFLIPFAVLIALSRIYLMVHYPTDVIAGFVVGTLAGALAFLIMKAILDGTTIFDRRGKKRRNVKGDVIEVARIKIKK